MVLNFKKVSDESSGLLGWSQQQQIGAGQEMAKPAAALRCPRCDSSNTKFCYYNNYSRLQPRHLCRACKRHWTAGGTLRNVPVGGGRKAKRPKTSDAPKKNESITDFFRQVLLQTPPPPPPPSDQYSYGNNSGSSGLLLDLLGTQLLSPCQFLPEFHGTKPGIVSSFDNASATASPPNSLSSTSGGDDGVLNLINGTSTANTWLWEPANYWSCWDGMQDLAAPGGGSQ